MLRYEVSPSGYDASTIISTLCSCVGKSYGLKWFLVIVRNARESAFTTDFCSHLGFESIFGL